MRDRHGIRPAQLHQLITAALLGIEADLDEHGWDQPAGIFMLAQNTAEPTAGLLRVPSGQFWSADPHPCRIMDALAEAEPPRPHLLHLLPAVGVHWEAWAARAHSSNPAAISQLAADTAAGRISERPDRTEVRSVAAMDRHGRLYFIERTRDCAPEVCAGLEDDTAAPPPVDGSIPRSLTRWARRVYGEPPTGPGGG